MAKKAKKHTSRGRKQDRARVAGGQDYEVRYEAKKTHRSKAAVKEGREKSRQQPEESRAPIRPLGWLSTDINSRNGYRTLIKQSPMPKRQ